MIVVSQNYKNAVDTNKCSSIFYANVLKENDGYKVAIGMTIEVAIYSTEEMAKSAMSWMVRAETEGEALFIMPTEAEIEEELQWQQERF